MPLITFLSLRTFTRTGNLTKPLNLDSRHLANLPPLYRQGTTVKQLPRESLGYLNPRVALIPREIRVTGTTLLCEKGRMKMFLCFPGLSLIPSRTLRGRAAKQMPVGKHRISDTRIYGRLRLPLKHTLVFFDTCLFGSTSCVHCDVVAGSSGVSFTEGFYEGGRTPSRK